MDINTNNTLAFTSEKVCMSLKMLWYQVLEGKIIWKQQRLKIYIFIIKIMTIKNDNNIIIFLRFKWVENRISVSHCYWETLFGKKNLWCYSGSNKSISSICWSIVCWFYQSTLWFNMNENMWKNWRSLLKTCLSMNKQLNNEIRSEK